jgi:hypothetical protein
MARGDLIDISALVAGGVSNAIGFNISSRTTGLVGNSSGEVFQFSRGIFTTTGLWTFSATGADVLLQWDSNGAGTTGGVESVILVGSGGAFTGLTANTAGVLLLT